MDILIYPIAAILLIIIGYNIGVIYSRKHPDHIFNPEGKGQDFDISLQRFTKLSERAKATFMYRFVGSLNHPQRTLLMRYLQKHIN